MGIKLTQELIKSSLNKTLSERTNTIRSPILEQELEKDTVTVVTTDGDQLIVQEFEQAQAGTAISVETVNDFPLEEVLDEIVENVSSENVLVNAPIGTAITVKVVNDFPLNDVLDEIIDNTKNPTPKVIVPEDRPAMLDDSEYRELIQDEEARPEDFVPLRDDKFEKATPDTEILAAGKRYFSVDSQVHGHQTQASSKGKVDNSRFVDDAMRGRSGKYWTTDDDNFAFVDDLESGASLFVIKTQESHNDTANTTFGRTVQRTALKGNKKKFVTANNEYARDMWKAYVAGGTYEGSYKGSTGKPLEFFPTIKTGNMFMDYVYDMPVPFSFEETKNFQVPRGALVSEIRHEYNFYIEDFEERIAAADVLDNTLPNMYVFLSELNSENPNPEFKNFITLDDTLETEEQLARRHLGPNKFDIKEHPIGQYYDLYAHQYRHAVDNGAVERLDKKFSNVVVSVNDVSLFNKYNEKSEMFPMLTDISIGTDKTTTFAQILKESQMTDEFVSKIVNRHLENASDTLQVEVATETIVQREGSGTAKAVGEIKTEQRRTWDIAELMAEMKDGTEQLDTAQAVFLGDFEARTNATSGEQFKFFKSLMGVIFSGKFQSLIKQKFRTLDELLDGQPAYSETVMYRIAKHEFGPGGKNIQNVWLPNSNEIDVLRYLDTQIKYNKRYTYKVWAYQMVIGTRYWYTDLDVQSFDHHATFKTYMEPSIKLIETPFAEASFLVSDVPPVPPDIDIIPYKGVDNEMLFYMKGNVGNFDAEPVAIEPTDEAAIEVVRESQRKRPDELITFGADDHPAAFEIFRVEEHPRSYADFTGKLRSTVFTDVDLDTLQGATSAGFVDDLKPNTKYYYTMRSVDIHGHFSNPTPIYEVQILNENGMIYPLIRSVEFAKAPNASDKPARRFVQIVPNLLQVLIDEEKSGYGSAETAEDVKRRLHLGLAQESLWDKTFKLRLTSKSTGKKIELNFGFEHKDDEKA